MTDQYLTTVLEEAERVAEHHDQVAQSTNHPEHEYLRYAVLRLLEGETDEMSVDIPQIDGVTVGYGADEAMCESWGDDVEWWETVPPQEECTRFRVFYPDEYEAVPRIIIDVMAALGAWRVWTGSAAACGSDAHLERREVQLYTYLGCRQDLYAETGAGDFAEDTTRERTPTGSYHRNCIRELSIAQQRANHRAAMTEVIARARQQGKLTGMQTTAIDITEGKPFWGKRDTEELKQQILGTKESNQEVAYQYATIQVVGNDLPGVLDAVPVLKGMARHEIVDELLEHATEMVDIELVLMDREFENSAVKDVCEMHGVHYLNPSKMYREEKLTAKRLAREDITVHVESEAAADGRPPRKRL